MSNFLSSKIVFRLALLLAFGLRILFEINNPKLTSDHSIQIEAAKNNLDGKGYSNAVVSADNLSIVHTKPLKLWATGLPIFLNYFNNLFDNLIYSEIFFQVIGILLFLTGTLSLLKFLNVSQLTQTLFLLLYAFNGTPFTYLGSTDLFTSGLFLWICLLTLKDFQDVKLKYGRLAFISFLSFVAATLRFACIPNIVIVPVFFALSAFLLKRKEMYIKSFIVLLFSAASTFLFYYFFPIDSSRVSFIDTMKEGNFYWSHLKWFDSFPIKTFFFTRPIEFHLPGNPLLIMIFRLSLHVFSLSLLIMLIFSFRKIARENKSEGMSLFFVLFVITWFVVIGFISQQSLTIPSESNSFGPKWMPPFWTHVYSFRYFVYCVFLLIVFYFIMFDKNLKIPGVFSRLFSVSYVIFLLWAVFYWFFVNYQFYSPKGNGAGSIWYNNKNEVTTFKIVNDLHKQSPESHFVIAHHNKRTIDGNIITYASAYFTDDYQRIVLNNFNYTKPLTLFVVMPVDFGLDEKSFLAQNNFEVLAQMSNELLVKIELN